MTPAGVVLPQLHDYIKCSQKHQEKKDTKKLLHIYKRDLDDFGMLSIDLLTIMMIMISDLVPRYGRSNAESSVP